MRKSWPVGARRGQGVIYVSNAKDARGERDFFTSETVGIPLPIPALVVVPNDCPDVSGKINVGDELESGLRMSLHYRPLFLGELAGLVQHLGRHDDLSDVVEKRANPKPEQGASVESGAVGENAGEERDSLAMAACVAILALDRVTPVARHLQKPRLESVVPLLHLREAMLRLHLRVESVRFIQTLKHFAVALLRPE